MRIAGADPELGTDLSLFLAALVGLVVAQLVLVAMVEVDLATELVVEVEELEVGQVAGKWLSWLAFESLVRLLRHIQKALYHLSSLGNCMLQEDLQICLGASSTASLPVT